MLVGVLAGIFILLRKFVSGKRCKSKKELHGKTVVITGKCCASWFALNLTLFGLEDITILMTADTCVDVLLPEIRKGFRLFSRFF